MKRLTYIYWGVPAACALSLLRGCVSGTAHVSLFWVSLLPALVLWGATWLRLQENRAMRPEFSALAVLPHLVFFGAMAAGEDLLSQVQAHIWCGWAPRWAWSWRSAPPRTRRRKGPPREGAMPCSS